MREIIDTLLNTQGSIQIACHRAPDGDTLGAGLGLYLWLKAQGKDARIYCIDAAPLQLAFLPGAGEISQDLGEEPALFVAVDTADPALLGEAAAARATGGGAVLNIDHHYTNKRYGKVNYIVDSAASTAEIIAELLVGNGQDVSADIANCLYTGIVTDTGQFSYDYTKPKTLRIAADLIERGAAFEAICSRIFQRRTLSKTRLIGTALNGLRLYCGGQVAVLSISRAQLLEVGASIDECENIVNFAKEIDGVQIAVLLREMRDGGCKASLRSSGDANVARLASGFGGGGHVKAAGCTLPGTLQEAEQALVAAAAAELGCQ